MLRRFPWKFALVALLLPLIGCAPQAQRPFGPGPGVTAWNTGAQQAGPRVRVGLLLPLTGPNAPLGQAMLNAAQMALFDQGDRRVEVVPRDTRGSPAGAAEAARGLIGSGVTSLAGPLTLSETAAVVNVARGANVPVFAFTSDESQAGPQVWVLGLTPGQQVRRIATAAREAGVSRFAMIAPDDAFGQRLAAALRDAVGQMGGPPPTIVMTPARATDFSGAAQQVAAASPEAVLIGHGPAGSRAAAQALAAAFPSGAPRLLGTALWSNDGTVSNEPALAGAWFPAPDPDARSRFESQYSAAFGERPSRLAGVAYDALALAARSARDGGPPVGSAFMGADGPVRLLANGGLARGLAVFAVRPGEAQVVQPAPVPGAAGS